MMQDTIPKAAEESSTEATLQNKPPELLKEEPPPNEPIEPPKEEISLATEQSPIPHRASRPRPGALVPFSLPGKGLSSALISGVIVGVFSALVTPLIVLINTGTFHAASQQMPWTG